MFGRTVFTAGDQTFLTDDLLLAALGSGRWDGLRRHVRALLEADLELGEDVNEELDARIDETAADFRYQRDLISAADTEQWLLARGLSADDWFAALRRRLLAEDTLLRPMPPAPPDPSDFLQAVWAEFVVSGAAAEVGESLARQAVADELVASQHPAPPPDLAAIAAELELVREHFPSLDPADVRRRVIRLDALGSALSRLQAGTVTLEAVRREVEHRALDLVRVECEVARFEDELRAREAALCVREDGLALEEAAEEAHTGVESLELWLEDLPPELRTPLRSASVGELLGPLAWEGAPALVLVTEKERPSVEDPGVRARVERSLLDRLLAERLESRVTWLLRF